MEQRNESGASVQLLVEVAAKPPALLLELVDPLDETVRSYVGAFPP
jgi:hypothetical protein